MFKFLSKKKTIRDIVVSEAADTIIEYSKWYYEHGLALPPKYARDPGAWTFALHKMAKAFRYLKEDMEDKGEYYKAKHSYKYVGGPQDIDKLMEIEGEIKEGLALFGENLLYLTDLPKNR